MGSSNSRHSINVINPLNEMKKIEEWTNMKMGNIIFDSDVDNWNVGTSVFDQKVIYKSNLIFLIEDDDNNLFGGYVNAKIANLNTGINDPKSFVFSLKSNGRLNGMLKFDITLSQHAFYLNSQSYYICLELVVEMIFVLAKKTIKINHLAIKNHLITMEYEMHFVEKEISHQKESQPFN